MMTTYNDHAALKVKIDEEPLNVGRTDEEVDAWLDELETGPWIDVAAPDYFEWLAEYKLPGYLLAAANVTPASNQQSAAHMLSVAFMNGNDLRSSSESVRTHLTDAVPGVVDTIARNALLALARPDTERWRNANWSQSPKLGDVIAARNL